MAKIQTLHMMGYCWAFKGTWWVARRESEILGNPYDTSQREYTFFSEKTVFGWIWRKILVREMNLAAKYPDKVKETGEIQYRKWVGGKIKNNEAFLN